jgi:hypothetical protein
MKRIFIFLLIFTSLKIEAQIPTPKVQWIKEVQNFGKRNTGLWQIPQARKVVFDSLGNIYSLFNIGDSLRLTNGVYRKSDGYNTVLTKINKSNASNAWAYPFKSNDSSMALIDIVITNNNQITILVQNSGAGSYRGTNYTSNARLFSFNTNGDFLWFKTGFSIQELRTVNQNKIALGYYKSSSDTNFSELKLDSIGGYYSLEINNFGQVINAQYLGTGGTSRTIAFSNQSILLQVEISKSSSFRNKFSVYKATDQRTSPAGGNLIDVITFCYAKNGNLLWVKRADSSGARANRNNFCSDNHGNVYLGLIYKRNCNWLGKKLRVPFAGDPNCAMAILNETTGSPKKFFICDSNSYSPIIQFELVEGCNNLGPRLRLNGCPSSLWPNLPDSIKNSSGSMCILFDFNGNYKQAWQDEGAAYNYSFFDPSSCAYHLPLNAFNAPFNFFGSDIYNTTGNTIAVAYAQLSKNKASNHVITKSPVKIGPIPSEKDQWNIQSSSAFQDIFIWDLNGKLLQQINLNAPNTEAIISYPNPNKQVFIFGIQQINGNVMHRQLVY